MLTAPRPPQTRPPQTARVPRRPGRIDSRTALVAVALAGMLCGVSLTLARIYDGGFTAGLLAGAGVGAVLLSLVTAALRLPGWSTAPISVLGLAGYTILAVRLSATAGDVPGGLADLAGDALANGIPRVLTAMIPIRAQPDTVLVPVLGIWLAGLAAAELALRYRRVLLSYTPIVIALGGALYLVGPNAGPAGWPVLGLAGFAAVGLAAGIAGDPAAADLAAGDRRALRVRGAASTLVGLAAILVTAALLGPVLQARVSGTPSDPRRYVTPPQLDSLDESPLARLSGWALDPGQRLFEASLTGGAARLRLAVLADYDGVTWRVGGQYRTAGRVLSGPQAAGGDRAPGESAEISQRITIDQLNGRLLPAAAVPDRVAGVRVAYDPRTTTLALPEGLRPGLAYTVVSRIARPEVNLLPEATVPTDRETVRRFVTLDGEVPQDIRRLATQLAESAETPYQRALAIQEFLAGHYRLVADAPSGHAYPNLNFFLFGPRNGGAQRGTSEQFAASFAVLGRLLGLPTRISVGFEPEPGRTAVLGAHALAWPEVLFEGIGWVSFNPLPDPNSKPRPVEEDFRPKPEPTTPPPSALPTPSLSATPSTSASSGDPAAGPPGGPAAGQVLAGVCGGLAILLVGLVGTVPLLRRSRRRRRLRAGRPEARVLGALQEVLDGLRQAGRRAPPALAATELGAYAALAAQGPLHGPGRPRPPTPAGPATGGGRALGLAGDGRALGPAGGGRALGPGIGAHPDPGRSLVDLADLVNLVVFAPYAVHPEHADHAARCAEDYLARLRAGQPRWRRWLWAFDPRQLLWQRQRPAEPATGGPPRPGQPAAGQPAAGQPAAGGQSPVG